MGLNYRKLLLYRAVEYHSMSDDSPCYYRTIAWTVVASKEGLSTPIVQREKLRPREKE